MRPLLRRSWLFALLLPSLGCIQDRIGVEITTYVYPDGSCSRRIEYRLERVDNNKTVPIPPGEDALRLYHRFPAGERWTVRDDALSDRHDVTAEAMLASPNDLDWDFWRQRSARLPPARNRVSFAMSGGNEPTYEYLESFVDPVSPLAFARFLAQLLQRKQDEFCGEIARALGQNAPRRSDIKRAYLERLALPFQKRIDALADGPIFGPRERKQLEAAMETLDELQQDLNQAIVALSPIAHADGELALKRADERIGEIFEREMESAGLPPALDTKNIRFRATLVMPAPIARANTCVQGNTAVWEFDQDDLFGRGFEMWAVAGGRP